MLRKWLGLVLLVGLLGACDIVPTEVTRYDEVMETNQDVMMEPEMVQDGELMSYTSYVSFDTTNYESDKESIQSLVSEYEGTVEYQDEYTGDYPSLSLTVSIPVEQLEAFLDELTEADFLVGETTQLSRDAQNVTQQVQDVELRLDTLDAQIERLTAMLEETDEIADIIQIQTALDEAIIQRDQLLTEQANLENQIDYANVTINLRGVETYDVDSPASFFGQLGASILAIIPRTIGLFQVALLVLINLIPYVLLLLVLYWLFRLFRYWRRRRRDNKTNHD